MYLLNLLNQLYFFRFVLCCRLNIISISYQPITITSLVVIIKVNKKCANSYISRNIFTIFFQWISYNINEYNVGFQLIYYFQFRFWVRVCKWNFSKLCARTKCYNIMSMNLFPGLGINGL